MPQRVGVTELKHTGYEIFIMALTVLSIVNLVLLTVINSPTLRTVVLTVNALLSLVLFLDFVFRFATAESRRTYFFRDYGWADLLASLPLAQLKVLRVFRLIRVWRIVRAMGIRNIARALVRSRAGTALFLLLLVAILMWEFGSLAMLELESSDPDRNIETASDALWYVVVTMSTVGYGDQFPVSTGGRVLGVVIIVLGVGIFGTLTGFLANAFLAGPGEAAHDIVPTPASEEPGTPGKPVERDGTAGDASTDEVRQQLTLLRAQHRDAIDRLDQLLAEPD
jgi:voltage-gated potassium channel